MCGLVVVKARDFRPDIFRALMFELTVQQSHRGPDGSNVEIIENHNTDNIVGLGHNLLSIIDSKSNIQPMYSWDTRYCIVFSGEIYNYEELRVKVSYSFKSETDTEILLVLYEKYGVSMLDFIKGMFAFVIYDSKEQKFFVARDRYGQKPLYYWTNERVLVISTEIKSILKCKEYSPSVDRMAAIQYFLTMDTFNWQTMFKGIKIFPPGNYASISIEDRNIDLQQYSYPKFCNSDIHRLPSETYADNLKFLLEQSVNRHTTENLNWALQLSGGLDSNTLAAVLVNIGHKNVGAYTCAYQLPGSQIAQWDESKLAVDSAKTLGLTANVVMLTPEDYIESLVKLVSVMEEPKGNSCMAQYHLVQNIAQDNYRIVWGGEGADELLAGYYWRYPQLFDLSDKSTALEIAWELWRSTRHTSRKDLVSFKDMNSAKQIFSASFTTCVNESSPDTLPLDHFMTFQIRHYLHFLLLQSDKLVSSVGMEGRFPFLDYDLSDYILSLPLSIRYRPDVPLAKPLLREAMAGLVPPNIIERQKRGFVPPESFWYRNQLQPLIQKWICSPDAHYKEYLNEVVVGNIVNLHSRSIVDASKLIWAILVFEIWHKIFIENEDMTKIRAI